MSACAPERVLEFCCQPRIVNGSLSSLVCRVVSSCAAPLLYKQVPAAISDAEEKRQGVEEVEVVFALPQSADGSAEPDPDAQVFAFLPCRPYGFRCSSVGVVS